jgi:ankyrin repeat protein
MSQEVFDAIRAGDAETMARLLANDPGLAHARNGAGVSALMQARYEHKAAIVDMLRQAVGKLDIFEAAALGNVPRLRELLKADSSSALAYSNDGFTALQFACFFGQPESAEVLAKSGSDLNAVSRNTMKVAVINTAAASGNAEIVKLVLDAGARPDHQQQAGYTSLHEAAAHNNLAMTQALLDAGADRDIKSDDGKTAFDMASEKGHTGVLELLSKGKKASNVS